MFERSVRHNMSRYALLLGLASAGILLVIGPTMLSSYYQFLACLVLINALMATGLNLLTGNAGQISLCNSSFMAIGAYATVYLSSRLGLPFVISLPLAGLIAAGFGFLLGLPALRVRGFYLAVVTLAFLEITQIVIESTPSITGGVRGILAPRPTVFGIHLSTDLSYYYLVLSICCLGFFAAYRVLNSPTGRAFNAIRNNESVAETLGIPITRIKLLAFVLSSFYAGIGGGMFAMLVGFVDPLEFGVWTAIQHIVFIVVGGIGSLAGSIVGATLITLLPEFLRGVAEYNELVYGILLLVFLIGMPKGVVGLALRLHQSASAFLSRKRGLLGTSSHGGRADAP